MNNSNLKKYAPKARLDFIEAVTARATLFGITEKAIEPAIEKGDVLLVGSKIFPKSLAIKRKKLEARIKQDGFKQVIEAIAYTWFNRLVAIRYMELKGYLDHGYRVLSHPKNEDTPEILQQATNLKLQGLDEKTVIELKLDATKESELYRLILIAQCNALNKAMPFLFESIFDETELLLPENLLHSDSLIRKLVQSIPEEEWNEVEIIGWLYQFYISDKKDEVMGKVVKSEDIPAATQLFTPNWIVKYLLQNSLGRQWMATYPDSSLKEKMEYYIEPAEQTPEVQQQLAEITPTSLNPEELTLLDPACGSGHILVEAYDLLKAIYQERGYRTRDIPSLILTKNLYGLEIDDRATQLASFALLMKARADDSRIFSSSIELNVFSIQNSPEFNDEDLQLFVNPQITLADYRLLLKLFEHGKTFGSLIRIPEELLQKLPMIITHVQTIVIENNLFGKNFFQKLLPILKQAQILAKKYDAVVTNPPYMGNKGLNPHLKKFLQENYTDVKSDLFSAFIIRNVELTLPKGYLGFVTPFVWMFISSYQDLRDELLSKTTITTLTQLEYNAFEPACIPVCVFTLEKCNYPNFKGNYIKLSDFKGHQNQAPKTLKAIQNPNCGYFYRASTNDFKKIPGSPIAYWVSERMREIFAEKPRLGDLSKPRQGMASSDDKRFVRVWSEVFLSKIGIGYDADSAFESNKKWFPYDKGGAYRKWYGNNEFLVNWEKKGQEVLEYAASLYGSPTRTIKNISMYFREGLTWTAITSGKLSVRYSPKGHIFSNAGMKVFNETTASLLQDLALLNSKISEYLVSVLSQTLNFDQGIIARLPVVKVEQTKYVSDKLITYVKTDWDSYETSWDFSDLPLLRNESKQNTLASTYVALREQWNKTTLEMQQLEEENNRIFIEAYGLQEELKPEVPLKEITLTCNPYYRYGNDKSEEELEALLLADTMKEFISYAVGCMFGRYSIDKPGLILANQGETVEDYLAKIPDQTFKPNENNVIPILDGDWFPDDIVNQFCKFLRITFGDAHYQENMEFIEEAMGKDIRNYFLKGFYDDHLKRYKKRPIYWLFSSGKQRAFQCLVYLHRYNEGTLARMRTEYVIPLLGKIASRIEQLGNDLTKATSTSHGKKLEKERSTLIKQQIELQEFDEKLRHFADQRIHLDLDDGVKVNYGKFGDLLAEVKAVTGEKIE